MHTEQERATARTRLAIILTLSTLPIACGDDDGDDDNATTETETDASTTDDPTLTSSPTSNTDPDSSSDDDAATEPATDSGDTTTGTEATLLERVVAGLGGAEPLDALVAFELTVSGERSVADEGADPANPVIPASTYETTVSLDIANAGLRLDVARTITFEGLGLPLNSSEILSGQLGVTEGVDNLFMAPGGPMLSDRWSSTWRQQRLFNPHLWIKDAVADTSIATETGAEDFDGRPHEKLELEGTVRPITLWVDSETDLVSRLTTLESSWLRRDVEVEVVFADWQASDGGVLFPNQVTVLIDGVVMAEETRSAVTTEIQFGAETFAIPKDSGATYVEEDAARGERTHTILQQFVSTGLPFFGLQTLVAAEELADGVWNLTGGTHHSLLVEQDGGLVLFETPLYEPRCLALLDWVDTNLPGQEVTHAVVTHYHVDHSACARTLVARGATLVVGEGSDVVWDEVLAAPSTVDPDELEANPVANPPIEYVPNGGSFTIEDGSRPVTVYDLENEHAQDMVLPFVETGGVALVADIFNPGQPVQLFGPAGAQAILDAMEAHGILGAVNIVAGAHGFGTATVADLQAVAGGG